MSPPILTPMLEKLAGQAIDILVKYEVIDEKVRNLGGTVNEHEKRICKLEGAYELNVTKVKNVVLEELLKLPHK